MINPTVFLIPCPHCSSMTSLVNNYSGARLVGVACLYCDKEMDINFWNLWAAVCDIEHERK